MNTKLFTIFRNAAGMAMGLGLVAVMLFGAVTPAAAGPGGAHVSFVNVGQQVGSLTYGTAGSVTYQVDVSCAGTGGDLTVNPNVSGGLPTGVSQSWNPVQLYWSNNCDGSPSSTKSSTLTLSTSTTAPAGGPTAFTVDANGVTHSGSITINTIQLNVTGTVFGDKTYNNDTNGSISTPGSLVGAPAGITLDLTTAGATFSQKSVGNNIQVNAFGYALQGAGASNYSVVPPQGYANINPKTLHVYMSSAADKIYDGTTDAVVTLTTDAYPSDNVVASGVGSFNTRDVGGSKLVTVPHVSLSGPGAGNYTPDTTTASGNASITTRHITVTASTDNKTYDRTTNPSPLVKPSITSGSLGTGDTSGFTQSFDTKNVGMSKTITPSGAVNDGNSGNNYVVAFVNNSGSISQASLTVSAIGVNKTYDGNNSATVTLQDNRVSGDIFTDSFTNAVFADKHVGSGKSILVTGIGITGGDASNYSLSSTTAPASADILKALITVSASSYSKPYDGNTSAAAVPTVTSGTLMSGDLLNFTEAFADKNVGTAKTLVPSGSINDGNGGGNYQLSLGNDVTGVITARSISVTADNQAISEKDTLPVFTFHYGAGNLISGDSIATPPTCGIASLVNPGVGSYPITCKDASDPNYVFSYVDGLLTVSASGFPHVAASPKPLNFGYQLVGTSSLARTITVTNAATGVATLDISNITVSGAPFSLVTAGSTCYNGSSWSKSLANGDSCTVNVKFSPTVVGTPTGNVTIESNDPLGASYEAALVGNAAPGTTIMLNRSFETDNNSDLFPDRWIKAGAADPADGRDCTVHFNGSCSLLLVGNGKQVTVSQTLKKSGVAGRGFSYTLNAKTLNLPSNAIVNIRVLLYNGTALVGTSDIVSFTKGTHSFKLVKGSYTAPADFTKVVFKITFKAAHGSVWFDKGTLKW